VQAGRLEGDLRGVSLDDAGGVQPFQTGVGVRARDVHAFREGPHRDAAVANQAVDQAPIGVVQRVRLRTGGSCNASTSRTAHSPVI